AARGRPRGRPPARPPRAPPPLQAAAPGPTWRQPGDVTNDHRISGITRRQKGQGWQAGTGDGRQAMERMSTLDAGFFFVEHKNVPMHLGSLMVFEGPAPAYRDIAGLFAAKLPLGPRYRQVVRTEPLHVFQPAWADDEKLEIGYHVRHAAVPKPGRPRQLRQLAGQVFAQRLDRDRPLWEAWFLEGIEGGRWALLSKVHHCMVDGIGGTDLMTAIFDLSPDAAQVLPPSWAPDPRPSAVNPVASSAPGP